MAVLFLYMKTIWQVVSKQQDSTHSSMSLKAFLVFVMLIELSPVPK
jgi:hypothetical protein